ncbi:MAG: hypothetical protein HWD92_10100 [Flavobacteriia bacterium]|nr:hypothetical protein [Flavobacteriia bacterium]
MKFSHLLASAVLATAPALLTAQTEEIEGTLSAGDLSREGQEYYDVHTVELDGARMMKVTLSSDEIDTYLIIKTPYGTEEYNDDWEGSDSYIEFLAEEEGTYIIWASSYDAESEGAYTLSIDMDQEVSVERIEGRLVPRDEQLPKGEYVDTYKRTIEAGSPFSVRMKSYGFDGFLVVVSPSGETFRNDDYDGDISISMLTGLSPESGEWTIHCTTLDIEEVGAYDLEIIVPE